MTMTHEQIAEKEAELTAKYNRKVTAHVFPTPEGDAVLFLKNPDKATKMYALDKSMDSFSHASQFLFEAAVVREESDARFFTEKEEDEDLQMGALLKCQELVKFAIAEIKKK
jgi:hypothetical protein